MKNFVSVGWCAVVVLWMVVFAQGAVAQFGGGKAVDNAAQKAAEMFETAAPAESAKSPPATPCLCLGDSNAGVVVEIQQVLRRPLKSTGLEFTEEPLENVVNYLQDEYDIPIQLDVPALEDAGMTADEPLSINLHHISLKSALRLTLKQKNLTYIIRNEVMIITTPEEAESELTTCVYDVGDLVTNGRTFMALTEAISSCIAPETWAENGGGEAEIRPVQPGLLVISQTQLVHEQVAELLAAIRKMRFSSTRVTSGIEAEGGIDGGHGEPQPEPTPANDPFSE